tara:strand:+ start:663 stop:980 length:318 start_codon:yes stop_codon:yes gene_type:complete
MNVSIKGDVSSDGGGAIDVYGVELSVKVQGLAIAINKNNGEGAASDGKCPDADIHCASTMGGSSGPKQGSLNVFAGGVAVHRIGDTRGCGATTLLVTGIRTVNVN